MCCIFTRPIVHSSLVYLAREFAEEHKIAIVGFEGRGSELSKVDV